MEDSAAVQWLNRRVGSRAPLTGLPADLDGLAAYCDDPDWMRRLLDHGAAREAIRSLLEGSDRTAAILTLAPRSIVYTRRYFRLNEIRAESVERWVDRLSELAGRIDRLGPSSDAEEPTRMELWARRSRGRYLKGILLGTLGCGLLVLALLTAWMLAVH